MTSPPAEPWSPLGQQLLTVDQVAERCQVSTKTVYRAIHSGRLRASQLGEAGAYRVRVEDVDAWVNAARVPPKDEEAASVEPLAPRASGRGRRRGSRGRLAVTEGMGRSG